MCPKVAHTATVTESSRTVPARIALALAGLGFAAFPLLRPWGDDSADLFEVAASFADPRWVIAHALSMLAFIALALGLRAARRPRLELGAWLGAALVLPFYGAEAFGLHAIGNAVVAAGDVHRLAETEAIRADPIALAGFALGLLFIAAVGLGFVVSAKGAGTLLTRIAVTVAGVGLVTYLPQFFLPAAGRIAHGVVLGGVLLVCAARVSAFESRDKR